MGKIAFNLERVDRYRMTQILEGIPNNWQQLSGNLRAPQQLAAALAIAMGTIRSYKIVDGKLMEASSACCKAGIGPGSFMALMTQGRLPEEIAFIDVSERKDKPIAAIKHHVIYYLQRGYVGTIQVASKINGTSISAFREMCTIFHGIKTGDEGPHVLLQWQESYGGNVHRLETIIKACQRIGLQEIKP